MKIRRVGTLMRSVLHRIWPGICILAIALVFVGCGHSKREDAAAAFSGPPVAPQPPVFVRGSMALILTNSSGYEARVAVEGGPYLEPGAAVGGELVCLGTKLLFNPDPNQKKGSSQIGRFNFLWDVATSKGYLLSEALQAYAPISSSAKFTNVMTKAEAAAEEQIDKHPCRPEEVTVSAEDGEKSVFTVWRAMDLKGFPMRVRSQSTRLTLTFSQVHLESPPEEAFAPPDGFAKYDTAEGLIGELRLRQANLRRKTPRETTGDLDLPARPAG